MLSLPKTLPGLAAIPTLKHRAFIGDCNEMGRIGGIAREVEEVSLAEIGGELGPVSVVRQVEQPYPAKNA